MANRRKYNTLSSSEMYLLRKQIDDDRSTAEKTEAKPLALSLSEKLGFKVSEHNVRGAKKDLGISGRALMRGGVGALYGTQSIIANAVVELYQKLGEDPPGNIVDLIIVKSCDE